jgi:hypothetical protein
MTTSKHSFEERKRGVLEFLANLAPEDEPLLYSIENLIFADLEAPGESNPEVLAVILERRKRLFENPKTGVPWEAVYPKLKNRT